MPGSTSEVKSVQEVFPRAHAGTVRAPDVELRVFALLADERLWDVGLADFGTRQVDPGVALVALDHCSASERFHAETRHQIPGVVVCNHRITSEFFKKI